MSRWRIVVVLVLFLAPVLALVALGSYYLWRIGLSFRLWWPMAASFILGYLLAWYWQRKKQLLKPVEYHPPLQWTERDREAWKLVEARAQAAGKIVPDRLTEFSFYVSTAQEMALELARFYHPGARDPFGSLTVPEILAVIELVAHDLAQVVDQYVPGSHLLTINNWRRAKQATDWYSVASKIYWAVATVLAPVQTGLRFAATHLGMTTPWRMLQENLILWFYTAYVHEVGTYLIDLHSGRLRVGASRYRELLAGRRTRDRTESADTTEAVPEPDQQVDQVTITVIGQVKAGKSSLVNALLGEQRAITDVLPMTDEITRYELHPPNIATRLVILDTVGFGHAGPREDQLRATEQAAQQSDLLLLVLHARNPARQPEHELLQKLRTWFRERPELKMPPILAVLTHIDLLSPAMEWAPPYHWQKPQRPKEEHIRQAWEAVREQLGDDLVGIAPVCTAVDKVYGINEFVLPALTQLLDEAHAVGLLRCLHAETDSGQIRKVFQQLAQAGRQVTMVLLRGKF